MNHGTEINKGEDKDVDEHEDDEELDTVARQPDHGEKGSKGLSPKRRLSRELRELRERV